MVFCIGDKIIKNPALQILHEVFLTFTDYDMWWGEFNLVEILY
jgi:hypothetical protein